MPSQRELRVLVATDGSRDAKAGIATTLHFPWAAETRVRIVSARRSREHRRSILLSVLDRGAEQAAEYARRTLSRRWPDVEVEIAHPVDVLGRIHGADTALHAEPLERLDVRRDDALELRRGEQEFYLQRAVRLRIDQLVVLDGPTGLAQQLYGRA